MGGLSKLIFGGGRYFDSETGESITPEPAILEVGMSEADFGNINLGAGGAIIIAAWITHKDRRALSILSLKENNLYAEGGKALAAGLKGNQGITELDISSNMLGWKGYEDPDMSGVIVLATALPDMGAMTKFDISSNKIRAEGGKSLAEGLKGNQVITELNFSGNNLGSNANGRTDTSGIVAIADIIPGMAALCSLDLSRNNIDADGVAFITAALKTHAIEHQQPCISIRFGDQDQHFWARTKDLRALLVATCNLNPSHCMPAISAYLLKDIAEWL
jgi:hypothetical protein